MSTRWLKALVVIIGCTVLIGCAAQKPTTTFQPYDFGPGLKSGKYFQEVDNFLVILDASASMSQRYKGRSKLDLAKDITDRMNRTMSPLKQNLCVQKDNQSYLRSDRIQRDRIRRCTANRKAGRRQQPSDFGY